MIIDHIGIVVRSIEEGVELWENMFGYHRITEITINTRQKVKVVFLQKENSIDIKLPITESSSVSAMARRGGGLHHICFKCENLHSEVARLNGLGSRTLSPPEPGEAFENEEIAFVFAGQGLNVELIETDKRANKILY